MITRIEIDGFKSFHNFAVNLRPFQVLVGGNGVGKSNLFDAIMLLSHLARYDNLYDAFYQVRSGNIGELFTRHPNGDRSTKMRFAVEMLIDKSIRDDLGIGKKITENRQRYELIIERHLEGDIPRLYVTHEQLTSIPTSSDQWAKALIPDSHEWIIRSIGRRAPYISTTDGMIYKHQDSRSGAKQGTPVERIERTILSTISSTEYPTAYGVRREMMKWNFLQLDPVGLREPTHLYSIDTLNMDGSNIAAVLYRLSRDMENDTLITDISRDMANLVDGIRRITVQVVQGSEKLAFSFENANHMPFSSQLLSDGTLRLLVLTTLKHDPRHQGVLCFEEPENGIHPTRLQWLVKYVLSSLASDFAGGYDAPLRQLIINTHSPHILAYVSVEDILYVYMPRSKRYTQVGEVTNTLIESDQNATTFTLHQVKRILDSNALALQQQHLEGAKETL